jgi:hypothetical protein
MPARRNAHALALLVLVAGALIACGGDDDDGSDAEASYAEALATSMRNDAEDGMSEEEANCLARRVVQMIGVDELESAEVSVDELAEADSLAEINVDLPDDAREQVGAAMVDCIEDLTASLGEGFTAAAGEGSECLLENIDEREFADAAAVVIVEGDSDENAQAAALVLVDNASGECAEGLIVASLVADGTITEDSVDCVRAGLDDEVARRMLRAGVAGEDPSSDDVNAFAAAVVACGG